MPSDLGLTSQTMSDPWGSEQPIGLHIFRLRPPKTETGISSFGLIDLVFTLHIKKYASMHSFERKKKKNHGMSALNYRHIKLRNQK